MSITKPTKFDFYLEELRWQEIELEVERLTSLNKKHSENIDKLQEVWSQDAVYAIMDANSAAIKNILQEQSEIEMFLIENEAPGWTST